MLQDDLLLFGSTLRFAKEYPSTKDQLRVLWHHEDPRSAIALETLLYAFYHCGVRATDGLQDRCDEIYSAWHKLGTQEFTSQYVQPLCAALAKHDSWTLTNMVSFLIERCTPCLQYDRLVTCRMNGCVCAMFASTPQKNMSTATTTLAIYEQLIAAPQQQQHIVFETPLKDMPTHRKRKHKKSSPGPKIRLDYSTEEE